MKKLYILLLGISLGGISSVLQGVPVLWGSKSEKSVQPKQRPFSWNDAKDLRYFPFFCGTIVHELGHAFAGKLLSNDSIDVHLGVLQGDNHESYLIKKYGVIIYGLQPKGYALSSVCSINKKIAILAAGPLAGALFYGYLGKDFINHYRNLKKYYLNNKEKKFINKNSCMLLFKFFGSTVMAAAASREILYGFTPLFGPGADGYKIYRLLGISKKLLNKCVLPSWVRSF